MVGGAAAIPWLGRLRDGGFSPRRRCRRRTHGVSRPSRAFSAPPRRHVARGEAPGARDLPGNLLVRGRPRPLGNPGPARAGQNRRTVGRARYRLGLRPTSGSLAPIARCRARFRSSRQSPSRIPISRLRCFSCRRPGPTRSSTPRASPPSRCRCCADRGSPARSDWGERIDCRPVQRFPSITNVRSPASGPG